MVFPSNPECVDRAILLATIPDLAPPYFLTPAIVSATAHTRTRLIIVLFSRFFNIRHTTHLLHTYDESLGLSHTQSWDAVQRILTFTYVQATKVAQDMDKVLMDVDVLLHGLNEDISPDLGKDMDLCFRVNGDSIPTPLPESLSFIRQSYLSAGARLSDSNVPTAAPSPPLPTRTARVRSFLTFFKPSITPDIVPITDVYGPTGWDPDIQALVVSRETLGGAEQIAKHRASHSLPPLRTFLIDVISATNASLDHADAVWLRENKLSSTFIRQWVADRLLREREDKEGERYSKSS
ncbi:unnamed protein product [Cyclocybe aegerita]|uniref:Uncharacterized protein n=1 Tax=Cyclocybe aegerita TaxID=1973307 RepID=A0A8S0X259_CYCAE|nr:unnamed protein product [Cyclocybe aegerita]